MKILYVANKYSPFDHDAGSGEDYNMYNAFISHGAQVDVVGPFIDKPAFLERVYHKAHSLFSKKRYSKYSLAHLRNSGRAVTAAAASQSYDVIFSHFLAPLVKASFKAPLAYFSDTPLWESNEQWPIFSRLEMARMMPWERSVVMRSGLIFTRSDWARDSFVNRYGIPPEIVRIVPMVSALPKSVVPRSIETAPPDFSTLRLLLVGKEHYRKGVDIAIEVVNQLNQSGTRAELRIVGVEGESTPHVRFMGLFKKTVPDQLSQYAAQYQWAHFLIHPARFEAAGIVTAEAAAFGVPTITNDRGGLGTTVCQGVSGVVLPPLSAPEAYVSALRKLIADPSAYQQLCQSTRQRYERELNWPVVGKMLADGLQELVEANKK